VPFKNGSSARYLALDGIKRSEYKMTNYIDTIMS
jgi:hypothetical protein